MLSTSYWYLLAIAVIGCGVVSGFFLTFSDFLMRSLSLARSGSGIEVMQIINREVWRSITIFLLWGMLALSVLLAGTVFFIEAGAAMHWVFAGAGFYFVGVLLVSYAFNIPLNKQLETHDFTAVSAQHYWEKNYLGPWSFWNRVRAISAAGSAICFLIALSKIV